MLWEHEPQPQSVFELNKHDIVFHRAPFKMISTDKMTVQVVEDQSEPDAF